MDFQEIDKITKFNIDNLDDFLLDLDNIDVNMDLDNINMDLDFSDIDTNIDLTDIDIDPKKMLEEVEATLEALE